MVVLQFMCQSIEYTFRHKKEKNEVHLLYKQNLVQLQKKIVLS